MHTQPHSSHERIHLTSCVFPSLTLHLPKVQKEPCEIGAPGNLDSWGRHGFMLLKKLLHF